MEVSGGDTPPLQDLGCRILLFVAAQQHRPTGSQAVPNPCESVIIRGESAFSGRKGWLEGKSSPVRRRPPLLLNPQNCALKFRRFLPMITDDDETG
jgi:hypothetical protein